MIYSMTGFIRQETTHSLLQTIWEIKSLNQRYLDIYVYLPDNVRSLETNIRKQIQKNTNINRGKIECKLYLTIYEKTQNTITLNTKLIDHLSTSIKYIQNQIQTNKTDPIKILSWPGVIIQRNINKDEIYPILLKSFNQALHKLIQIRSTEGKALKEVILKRLQKINNIINDIKKEIPNILPYQKQKLLKKIEEIHLNINKSRLEEELLLYTQRSDISEEIDRLEIHINSIHRILSNKHAIGRQLDFIAQELYREINTISSKSINIKMIQSSIKIKVLIEQIREQIQNIE